ncbi:hypothetical protein MMC12_003386 [Toensbergia leucococca]|nr:hypothetical protein [Toensbergia leucococca]
MDSIQRLLARDDSSSASTFTPTMVNLLIALLVLVVFGFCLVGGLFILRSNRKSQQQKSELPFHNPKSPTPVASLLPNHRRLTITAAPYGRSSDSINIYNEKHTLVEHSASPPTSPIPEIRITFPEEEDEAGKRKSGRVVTVRISDNGGVGLEPCDHSNLPPYQRSESERFVSLDLERIGGLKENDLGQRWS